MVTVVKTSEERDTYNHQNLCGILSRYAPAVIYTVECNRILYGQHEQNANIQIQIVISQIQYFKVRKFKYMVISLQSGSRS